jgi:hypothetical protein
VKPTPRIATMSGTLGARRSRSPLALAATLLASVALLLAVATPAANAATATDSYGYLTSFGDTEAFYLHPTFNVIAADESTGNIFVAEEVNPQLRPVAESVVQVYSPDPTLGGVPLATLDTTGLGYIPFAVAIDQANGAIYILDDGGSPSRIAKFVSDGAPVPTYTEDPSFSPPTLPFVVLGGLAVDPVTHDVLVGSRESHSVYRYDATGAFVSSFDGSNTAGGAFTNVGALAAGPGSTIYVVDDDGRRVERFSSAGASLGALPISDGGAPTGVAVNPQSGESVVLVNRKGQFFLEAFDTAGQATFAAHIPAQIAEASAGLAWDAGTNRIYLGTPAGTVHTFVLAKQPGVDGLVVSQITGTSAHLETKVAPGGEAGEATKARIEYCPATANCANPGSWIRLTEHEELETAEDVPPGSGEKQIEDDRTGLIPNSEYLVRVSADRVAADGAHTDNTSPATSFSTSLIAPEVHTGQAGAITPSGAQLSGTIATYGNQTTYHFEYGLTTNYGSSAPVGAEGVAGSERATRTFTRTVTGLQTGTEYHYRLVAHNAAGETAGEDRTFTTIGTDEVAPGRAYEQVTPVDKRGATIRPDTFLASADGSALVYGLSAAATDSASAPIIPRYLSRRGTADWSDWEPLDPPLNAWRAFTGYATQAVSEDLTHSFVVSNRALVPEAVEDGANIYIQDLQTGAYTFVGCAGEGISPYVSMNGLVPPNNYLAGAPDFSWVILFSRYPLLPGVTGGGIYKWTETQGLELESRLPGSNGGSVANGEMAWAGKDTLRWPVASEDGDVTYFSFRSGPDAGVYRRENGQTTAISVSEIPGDPATPLAGQFDGASRDGRYAFFRSGRLTPDAPEDLLAGNTRYLYRYDAKVEALTYIGSAVNEELARVIGISDDGQTIYYNAGGEGTVVWRDGLSHTVTPGHPDAGYTGEEASPGPSGRYLAYLIPIPNAVTPGDSDVWLYDAETDQSVCVSCRPDGSLGGTAMLNLGDRDFNNSPDRVVLDDGTVFFDTTVPLVPADHNGRRDVYSSKAGKLTLISPGDGNFEAVFADASADGSNVFFFTDESLVGQDTDGESDVYDARIGGGFPAQSPPAPSASCIRSECGEADSSPIGNPPIGSSGSQPPAKPKKHCRKGTHARKVAGKTRCVKPAKHKKKAHRANTNRRQGR